MVMIILPHSHYDADHLDAVTREMQTLGAPTIKVIDGGDHYVALEGAHRLRAALDLGLAPIVDIVEYAPQAMTDDVVPGSYDDNHSLEQIMDGSSYSEPLHFDAVEML